MMTQLLNSRDADRLHAADFVSAPPGRVARHETTEDCGPLAGGAVFSANELERGAELGLSLLEQFGTRLPMPAETCLACGACDSDKDCRDVIRDALFDVVDSVDITSIKLDEICDEDFQSAPLIISFRKMIDRDDVEFVCHLKTCEWRGRRVRIGYEVEVSG